MIKKILLCTAMLGIATFGIISTTNASTHGTYGLRHIIDGNNNHFILDNTSDIFINTEGVGSISK
ncbi:MAG: hypothetical protein IJ848_01250 [Alphaproteobacteria bacterium]|nr:hypothetical protein [Alphaproteobacteria bacterium]